MLADQAHIVRVYIAFAAIICCSQVVGFVNYPVFENERVRRQSLQDFIDVKSAGNTASEALSATSAAELSLDIHYLYRVQKNLKSMHNQQQPRRVQRRSISNAVIETARCEHIELLDCDDYDSDEMTCMVTATGMPCCICTGKLKSLKTMRKKKWSLW